MNTHPRIIFSLIILFLAPTIVSAKQLEWSCNHGIYDLCGYSDGEGELLTGPYEDHEAFSEGFAAVKIDGKWGFIDEVGSMVIPAIYDDIKSVEGRQFVKRYEFSEGFAPVLLNGKWGLVDPLGATVLPHEYEILSSVMHGLAVIGDQTGFELIRTNGEIIYTPHSLAPAPLSEEVVGIIYLSISGVNIGFYNINTGWIIQPKFLDTEPFDGDGTMLWVTEGNPANGSFRVHSDEGDVFGLIRLDGTWALEPQFTHVEKLTFIEEADVYASFVGIDGPLNEAGEVTSLYGVLNEEGELVIPTEFDEIVRAPAGNRDVGYTGYIRVKKNGSEALFDYSGNLVGGRFFDAIWPTAAYDTFRVEYDGITATMNGSGEINPDYDIENPDFEPKELLYRCNSGLEVWNYPDGFRVFDESGQLTTPHVFSFVYIPGGGYRNTSLGSNEIPIDCDYPFTIRIDGKEGVLTTQGKMIFDPPYFDGFHNFAEDIADGFVAFEIDEQWGIVTINNQIVLPATYDSVYYVNGVVAAEKNGRRLWGHLNPDGEFNIPLIYDLVNNANGAFMVQLDDRVFWVDENNVEILPPVKQNDEPNLEWVISCHPSDRLGRRFLENGLWGIETIDGEVALDAKFQAVSCFDDGIAWAPRDDLQMWCPIGPEGNWQSWPDCKPVYTERSAHSETPPDDYTSSVEWMRSLLAYGVGEQNQPPWEAQ